MESTNRKHQETRNLAEAHLLSYILNLVSVITGYMNVKAPERLSSMRETPPTPTPHHEFAGV